MVEWNSWYSLIVSASFIYWSIYFINDALKDEEAESWEKTMILHVNCMVLALALILIGWELLDWQA